MLVPSDVTRSDEAATRELLRVTSRGGERRRSEDQPTPRSQPRQLTVLSAGGGDRDAEALPLPEGHEEGGGRPIRSGSGGLRGGDRAARRRRGGGRTAAGETPEDEQRTGQRDGRGSRQAEAE